MGQNRAMVLCCVPIQRGQAGQRRHAARRAIVEPADVGGIAEPGDVPVERVFLAEPAAQLGRQVGRQAGGDVKDARARRAAHPFQAGRHREIHLGGLNVKRQKAHALRHVHPDQAAHAQAMGDHRSEVDAVRGGGGHPGQQRKADIGRPASRKSSSSTWAAP